MTKDAQRNRLGRAPQTEVPYLSAGERRAKGKALRDKVPRASQAGWKAQKGRRDPVKLLCDSNAGRVKELIPIRFGAHVGVAVRVLSRLGGADGRRPCNNPDERNPGAGLRRCAPDELRRLRDAGTQRDLRCQRSRRDASGPVRMGPQAAGGERGDRGAIPEASRQ
jgi:hypothetical protein